MINKKMKIYILVLSAVIISVCGRAEAVEPDAPVVTWNNYSPHIKEVISLHIRNKNCVKLKAAFSLLVKGSDIQFYLHGESNFKILAYMNFHMDKIGC